MLSNSFATLTQTERNEYNAYLDDLNAQVRDPLPSDFAYAEQVYSDQWKDETTESITDDELHTSLLWRDTDGRGNVSKRHR